jgi:hypothetical protein
MTHERVPLDWATTQNNLGLALQVIGDRESGTAKLEEAIAAYREALKERTCECVPLDWAASFGDQGITLLRLAERTKTQRRPRQRTYKLRRRWKPCYSFYR